MFESVIEMFLTTNDVCHTHQCIINYHCEVVCWKTIRFENVYTVPPLGKTAVLKGIDLQINPGEMVGVIGPSAAGKSSFAKTAVGVWAPSNGHIRIDGADIHQYNRHELGKHIGYLPQDIELFEGTIAQNISRFDEDPSDQDIIEAARLSGTHELILNLPDGYASHRHNVRPSQSARR
jgi:ABC-type protease/lipase transport system fused ATPase/permease subunit